MIESISVEPAVATKLQTVKNDTENSAYRQDSLFTPLESAIIAAVFRAVEDIQELKQALNKYFALGSTIQLLMPPEFEIHCMIMTP